MSKNFAGLVILLTIFFAGFGFAEEEKLRAGVDLAMPYFLLKGGSGATSVGNLNVGLDVRYFTSDALSFGGRAFFDVQDSKALRQMGIAPGMQYHWMPSERWDPYFRLDLPVILRGAPNSTGNKGEFDAGVGAGLGLAWNLGDAIGANNFILRYDFALNMTLGIGDAISYLSLDLFRIGVDYRF